MAENTINMPAPIWKENRATVATVIGRLLNAKQATGFPAGRQYDLDVAALLATARDGRRYRNHLLRALGTLGKDDPDPVAALESALRATVAASEKNLALAQKKWFVTFGVDTRSSGFSTGRCRVRVLGTDFVFLDGSRYLRRWNRYATADMGEFFECPPRKLFVCTTAEGVDVRGAYRSIERAFETLRGCIEIRLSFGVSKISSAPRPLREFPSPDWIIAVRCNEGPQVLPLINPSTTLPRRGWLPDPLTPEIMHESLAAFAFLQEDPPGGSVDSLIGACLRLYVQALDQPFPYAQFLGLWQLAEAICGVQPGQVRGDPVPFRLGWFQSRWSDFDVFFRTEVVQSLQDMRHDLVHKGTLYEIDQEDVNLLKFLCEKALSVRLGLRKDLPTRPHLDAFYSLLGQRPEVRSAILEA